MPKEIIQSARIDGASPDPNSPQTQVKISWGRGFGVINFGVKPTDSLPGEGGLFTDLGPAEIDRLIKVLRRARRQIVATN